MALLRPQPKGRGLGLRPTGRSRQVARHGEHIPGGGHAAGRLSARQEADTSSSAGQKAWHRPRPCGGCRRRVWETVALSERPATRSDSSTSSSQVTVFPGRKRSFGFWIASGNAEGLSADYAVASRRPRPPLGSLRASACRVVRAFRRSATLWHVRGGLALVGIEASTPDRSGAALARRTRVRCSSSSGGARARDAPARRVPAYQARP